MWYRHKLKQEARHTLRQNYWRILLLCLLVSFLVGSMIILNNIDTQTDFRQVVQTGRLESKSNSQIVNDFLRGDAPPQPTKTNFTQGFFAIIINNIYRAGSFLFGTLNAFNQIFFQDRIGPGIIIFIGALIYLLYWFLVSCIVQVGQCRFFLETRTYYKTPINRLLFSYRLRYGIHTAWAMLVRQLYLFFWWLTLIGGIIKTYSYRLMPYILAENPSLSRREAMQLSQAMMQGQKWQTFLLDLSFLGWQLLDILSFHLSRRLLFLAHIRKPALASN